MSSSMMRASRLASSSSTRAAVFSNGTQRVRNSAPAPSQQIDALSASEWRALRMASIMARCNPAGAVAEPAAPAAPAAPTDDAALAGAVDIRVGKIVKVELHPEADSLYVEQIDVGEPEPRTIVSGLVKFVPMEQMQDRKVIVICNLQARNLKGIKSNGMVLCASNEAHDVVEPLAPPADAPVGERVWFGEGNAKQPAPAEPNRIKKKKIWEGFQPLLKTSDAKVAGFKGQPMLTSAGPVTCSSLTNASIA